MPIDTLGDLYTVCEGCSYAAMHFRKLCLTQMVRIHNYMVVGFETEVRLSCYILCVLVIHVFG